MAKYETWYNRSTWGWVMFTVGEFSYGSHAEYVKSYRHQNVVKLHRAIKTFDKMETSTNQEKMNAMMNICKIADAIIDERPAN